MKLVFGFSLDFFPPHGSRKRSGSNSIGLLAIYCLNFRLPVRYLPEHMHISIITGKMEPHLERINPYLRPTVDVGVIAWERGIRLSKTALCEEGRILELAFPLSVNDLPAARKVSGTAGHGSHTFCTVCQLRGRHNLYRTDFENWTMRDKVQMRADAEAWRDADTLSQQTAIFNRSGLRYSELWRLPYWDPPKMLPTEAMHDIFEGLGKFFSREVLVINLEDAKKHEDFVAAFDYDFALFDSADRTIPKKCRPDNEFAEKDVSAIHRLLVSPLSAEPESDTEAGGDTEAGDSADEDNTRTGMKKDTDTPAWVHHVPKNYGEPAAGSIKADQMRLVMTIYLPIALVIMWAEQTGPDAGHFRALLNHAMALFQAVTIVCRYAMTPERATAYRKYLKQWVDDLYICHPHTKYLPKRTIVHIAFHIYDFIELWGPVLSWWAFPVERLIGLLQKNQVEWARWW
ncbi:hypothetical protein C8R44DRAFT_633882 [Mycena epipterygia]|nr:hypothetical protein C8R44DRAFT_633882 [Mycena epipterygia]